jgi:hypothetical protein
MLTMLVWLGKIALSALLGALGDFLKSWQRDRDLERLGYEKSLREAAQRHARDLDAAGSIRDAVRRRAAVDDWLSNGREANAKRE